MAPVIEKGGLKILSMGSKASHENRCRDSHSNSRGQEAGADPTNKGEAALAGHAFGGRQRTALAHDPRQPDGAENHAIAGAQGKVWYRKPGRPGREASSGGGGPRGWAGRPRGARAGWRRPPAAHGIAAPPPPSPRRPRWPGARPRP